MHATHAWLTVGDCDIDSVQTNPHSEFVWCLYNACLKVLHTLTNVIICYGNEKGRRQCSKGRKISISESSLTKGHSVTHYTGVVFRVCSQASHWKKIVHECMLEIHIISIVLISTHRIKKKISNLLNPLPFALDQFRHPHKRARATIVARKRLDFNCPFWCEARMLLQLLPIIGKFRHRRLIVWSGRSPVIFFGTNQRRLSSLG